MTLPVTITDPDDRRVSDFVGLTDVAARSTREPAEGLFIAEGAKVIRRALEAGHRPRSVLTEPRWLPELAPALRPWSVEVNLATPAVLRAITGYRVHRGALASFHRPVAVAGSELLVGARFVVVLVDLVDHTNVGALFRTAAALGADAVLVTPACADPLYRRAIKVSMGAVLSVPWARSTSDPVADLADLRTIALTPAPDAPDIGSVAHALADSPRALLLGTEGDGLARDVLHRVDVRARIPMAGGIDSLNVAAAGAIAMHLLRPTGPRRQRPGRGTRARSPVPRQASTRRS